MAKPRIRDRVEENDIAAIITAVARHPTGADRETIAEALPRKLASRTLQFWLRKLVEDERLNTQGVKRAVKYHLPPPVTPGAAVAALAETDTDATVVVPISSSGAAVRRHLSNPVEARKPVGYHREFLDNYRPNVRFYLSEKESAHLRKLGTRHVAADVAGTYAKQILNHLLIDLSWNSSRLEGNTYSLIDTRRLIEFGEVATGRDRLEAQMIMNHKEAIEFLVNAADEIGFNRYTILNLHAILANNLDGYERRGTASADRSRYRALDLSATGCAATDRGIFRPNPRDS